MKTLKNITTISLATLALTVLSGCTQASKTPVAKVEKNFKNSYKQAELKNAVHAAAKQNGWEVVKPTASNAENFELKKTFVKYKRQTGTQNRWKRTAQDYDVNVVVSLGSKKLMIEPTKNSIAQMTKHNQKDIFNEDIKTLESDVYTKLATHTL